MTLHYHVTPLTPTAALESVAGSHFCVSYYRPDQIEIAHRLGQSVMLDNGAYSFWRDGVQAEASWWQSYYLWAERWLSYPTTWAVIPDVIDGGEEANDALLEDWPHGDRGVPVWHMHESLDRLRALCAEWPKVAIGSSGLYSRMQSPSWHARMEQAFNAVWEPGLWLHLLRGMDLTGGPYPFASVDSSNLAQNHHRSSAVELRIELDARQCPAGWVRRQQLEAVAG